MFAEPPNVPKDWISRPATSPDNASAKFVTGVSAISLPFTS